MPPQTSSFLTFPFPFRQEDSITVSHGCTLQPLISGTRMVTGFRCRNVLESRRAIWFAALAFATVVLIQIIGHPFGYIGSFQMQSSTRNSSVSGNLTHIREVWNTTGSNVTNYITSVTDPSRGKDGDVKEFSESDDIDPEDELPSKDFDLGNNSQVAVSGRNDSFEPETISNIPGSNMRPENTSSPDGNTGSYIDPALEKNGTMDTSPAIPFVVSLPLILPPPLTPRGDVNANSKAPATSPDQNKDSTLENNEGTPSTVNRSPIPAEKDRSDRKADRVVSIAEMNVLLQQSRTSFRSVKPRWSSPTDQDILNAKARIEDAPLVGDAPGLYAPLYRNLSMFIRSYELMEQTLKVYVYAEGKRPIFHTPVLKGIYASEGWFMKVLKSSKQFVTKNPKKAHLFYLPFSSRMLEETLYVPDSHNRKPLVKCLSDYLNVLIRKHDFWNRTIGADHFLVACHDWAPSETKRLMANCIRALCNADASKEGFQFGKDASLPETYVKSPKKPLRGIGGKSLSRRHNLAFFAGNMHGYLRPILLQHWENKDPEMKIFGHVDTAAYVDYMKSSKYCICAKGYEVNSPRVVEALSYECVPVIISDNFVPPFFETLNWESFTVFVPEKDIPDLKNILKSIPDRRFREMQRRVKLVQQHFLWHMKPVKYDAFHMILHSVWHNRVFGIRTG
ncbi:PREDICTED: probable glycosyltransferase At5g03795 isoform X2 [Ipomoea nil]|uniref:probable glycosyltransferase At5g03795 isoform X2 n=1 Tax=Ipomoea nil TaxID=35883 RepID=UPI0009011B79|nr:PREDICTED: probable glycosyltransferase At5g03795 isoform X2 [Ipomoea nil]